MSEDALKEVVCARINLLAKDRGDTTRTNTSNMNTKDFEIERKRLLFPSDYQNISADILRASLLEDYILEASLALLQALKKRIRSIDFYVKKTDEDLLVELFKNWKEKKIKVETSNDLIHREGEAWFKLRLFW
jgi:hypothetical protein